MKKLVSAVFAVCIGWLFYAFPYVHAAWIQDATLFVGKWCGSCAEVEKQLETLDLGSLVLEIKDVYQNPDDATLFNEICDVRGISMMERSVPMLSINEQCVFGDDIIPFLREYVWWTTTATWGMATTTSWKRSTISLPVVMGAALVDAINPCAFAVLIILMTTLLITSTRKKALLAWLTFSASIFISYFLMWLWLYKVISSFETSHVFMYIVWVVALILWLLNIKDYFWYGKWFLLEVPLTWRPKLRKLLESVASPIGAFFVGFVVSLFLLPCTSGPYIVIISMLGHSETYMSAVWYLVLYNLVFVLPMLLITLGVYFGLDIDKLDDLRQTNVRVLHLVAWIILLIIGAFVLFW